ncbi:acetylxylan esterase [Actinomadura fulvescens]|uniref:poly(ethylene terephthalate) hydrolase n=1 Tax=Actinomadura fulvescens TaxID=46160 RepID=A0ABN3Q643_9ACTN
MRRCFPIAASVTAAAAAALLVSPLLATPKPVPARTVAADAAPSPDRWAAPGPHGVTVTKERVTTFYFPSDIGSSARRFPVVIWGNGTGAVPSNYHGLLRLWASHGFIVAAANTRYANSGNQMRAGLDRLAALDRTDGSPFEGRVDLARVGAAGHSQGGAGAINASADQRVDTTVPIQPGPLASASSLHGPALYLAGEKDTIVAPARVRTFYNASGHVPAIYTELAAATHFTPAGNGGGFRGITTAWWRFHLAGDEQARGVFFGDGCGICSGSPWLHAARNSKALQIPGPNA